MLVERLVQSGHDLPLLARVVLDRDVLGDDASRWDSELELGLDFLGNGRELVLVEPDVGPVERLEDHIASVGGRLGRVASQLEGVLVGVVGGRVVPGHFPLGTPLSLA